jgi:hypothetical protein
MGNILSNESGVFIEPQGTPNTLSKNITDLLFELDLYNTGKYYENNPWKPTPNKGDQENDPSHARGPRPEYNFDNIGKGTGNNDVAGSNRPINSKNELIDIIGIPYTDIDISNPQILLSDSAVTVKSNQPIKDTTNSSKYYNLKRGFCMGSNTVPIDLIGVDIPYDDPNNKQGSDPNLIKDQKIYKVKSSETINSCLIWGTTTPPPPGTPLPPIPDLGASGELLNDYSKKNIYNKDLSPDCISALDDLLTNSYISPKIVNYSKLNGSIDPKLFTTTLDGLRSNIKNYSLLHDELSNTFQVQSSTGNKSAWKNATNPITFGLDTKGRNSDGTELYDLNNSCHSIEEKICNYFYYYDINDAILFNQSFNKPNTGDPNPPLYYQNNINYLNKHIPDCRCVAINKMTDGQVDYNTTTPPTIFGQYWGNDKCDSSVDFGNTNSSATSVSDNVIKIFNSKYPEGVIDNITGKGNSGYRRQKDPARSAQAGTLDQHFLYVPLGWRAQPVKYENFYCNQSLTINVQGTGGNAVVSGNKLNCSFNAPPPTGATTATPGTGTGTASNPGSSSSTSGISITGITYTTTSKPVNSTDTFTVNQKLSVSVSYPTDSYERTFLCYYSLSFVSRVDPTNIIYLYNPVCNGNSVGDNGSVSCVASGTTPPTGICKSPYTIKIPFVYGPTYKLTDPYTLMLMNQQNSKTNTISTVKSTLSIKLQQYSMKISSIQNTKNDGYYYIKIGINLYTTDVIPNLFARVILTPVTASATPPGKCLASTPPTTKSADSKSADSTCNSTVSIIAPIPDLFNALSTNNNILQIGGAQYNICSTKYYINVKIGEQVTYDKLLPNTPVYIGGYDMLYDTSMPISKQCVVDFTQLTSSFSTFKLQYIDYDNDNTINNLASFDTIKFASNLILSWNYSSLDSTEKTLSIYYDTNINYDIKTYNGNLSPTAVALKTGFQIGNNSYNFICPILDMHSILIYAIIDRQSPYVYSTPILINISEIPNNFRNWPIVTNMTSSETEIENIITPTNVINTSIDDYFATANKTTTTIPKYKYIIYDGHVGKWYGGNNTLTAVASGKSTQAIFTNPVTLTSGTLQPPLPTIQITSINGIKDLSSPFTMELGSIIKLNYTITPITSKTQPTNIQVVIANASSKHVMYSFDISSTSPGNGTIEFTMFCDITMSSPQLYLTSYNTISALTSSGYTYFTSNKVNLVLNAETTNSVTVVSSQASINSKIPIINIISELTTGTTSSLNNLNITYAHFTDNDFYTILSNFLPMLIINNASITFDAFNFIMPFTYCFALPIKKPSTTKSPFRNVSNGRLIKNKMNIDTNILEYMDGGSGISPSVEYEIHISKLSFDFSKTTIAPLINIELFFSGYSKVYIQNLELIFGTNNLNKTDFNIELLYSKVTSAPIFSISNITIIGNLTSNIFFTKTIPGLNSVSFSTAKKINNDWINLVTLTNNNGYYSIPETYQASIDSKKPAPPVTPISISDAPLSKNPISPKVSDQTSTPILKSESKLAVPPTTPSSSSSSSSDGMSIGMIVGIVISIILLLAILAFVYFNFIAKKNK